MLNILATESLAAKIVISIIFPTAWILMLVGTIKEIKSGKILFGVSYPGEITKKRNPKEYRVYLIVHIMLVIGFSPSIVILVTAICNTLENYI